MEKGRSNSLKDYLDDPGSVGNISTYWDALLKQGTDMQRSCIFL